MSVYLTLLWYILCKHKLTYEMSVPLNCILYGWFSKPVEKSRASISNWAAAAAPPITTVFSSCQQQKNVIIWDSEWNREWKKWSWWNNETVFTLCSLLNNVYILDFDMFWDTHCVCERELRAVRMSSVFFGKTKRQLVRFIRNEKYGIEWISIKCTPRTH